MNPLNGDFMKTVTAVCLVCTALWCGTVRAEEVYLIFTEPSPAYSTQTFVKLLRSELNNYKKVTAEVSDENCTTAQCASDNSGDADYGVFVDAIKLGSLYKYDISVMSPKTGKKVFHTNTGKAVPEELDVVAKRTAEAIVKKDSFADTLERGEAVEQETQAPKLRPVQMTYGGSIGAAYPMSGIDKGQTQVNLDGGLALNVDKYAVEFNMPVRFNQTGSSKNTEVGLDILGRYYFTHKNISPFALTGIGVHVLKETAISSKWGFAGIAGLGVSFLRTTKIEVPITVKYQYLVLPGIQDPQSIIGTVGVYF